MGPRRQRNNIPVVIVRERGRSGIAALYACLAARCAIAVSRGPRNAPTKLPVHAGSPLGLFVIPAILPVIAFPAIVRPITVFKR